MKSFKRIVTEVAQPKAEDEIDFKAKHELELIDEPNAEESQFDGGTKKTKPRKADYVDGEDEAVYEALKAYVSLDADGTAHHIGTDGKVVKSFTKADGGIKAANKHFAAATKVNEENLYEAAAKGPFTWEQINTAMMTAGFNPPQILKLLSALNKTVKEDVSEGDEVLESFREYDYNVSSEKTADGSFRPQVKHRHNNTTLYLGSAKYDSHEKAKDGAKAYLRGYGTGGANYASKQASTHARNFAVKKTVKEDVSDIQELSKATLKSYVKKSLHNTKLNDRGGDRKDMEKADRRRVGISKAVDRLAKEDVQDEAFDTLKSYVSAAVKSAARSRGKGKVSVNEESLDEAAAFASGTVKFGDGKTGNVKEQDASILNTLYAKLKKEGAGSHEEMHKHAMENQKNFKAVVEFAIATVGKK